MNYELSNIDVKITNTAVLDGQQRLTSLFLSLLGNAHIRQKHARKNNSVKSIERHSGLWRDVLYHLRNEGEQ